MLNQRHPSSVGVAEDQDKNNRKKMTRITIWCQFLKRGIRKDKQLDHWKKSLEEVDLTLKRSNTASGSENVMKKRRGRPPKSLSVVNI